MQHDQQAIDANNKTKYCDQTLENETRFLNRFVAATGENLIFNPARLQKKYVIDFHWYDLFGSKQPYLTDYKLEATPYFTVQHYHNVDPQFAVTFGLKDMFNYTYCEKADYVIFHIDWKKSLEYDWLRQGRITKLKVKEMECAYYAPIGVLQRLASMDRFHTHITRLRNPYERQAEINEIRNIAQRVLNGHVNGMTMLDCMHPPDSRGDRNDKGNFVYDIRWFTPLWFPNSTVTGTSPSTL